LASSDRVIPSLIEEHQEQLKSAHEAGLAAHPGLDVPFEQFARRLVVGENGSTDICAPAGLTTRLAELQAADYFLATACECSCPEAWERLLELYLPRLRAMALRWGASAADADEVARDLPGELLSQPAHGRTSTLLGTYNGTGSLLAWLGTIVDRGLSRRARNRTPLADAQLDVRVAGATPPPDIVVHSETGARVGVAFESALLDLSAREFLLVAAKFRDGRSQRDIAAQLDISEARVSYLMKRALDRIRDAVRRDVPDETAAHWLHRDGLAAVLKDVIARLLERPPTA